MAFTAFGVALIVARTVAGHLPDRFGGARIALIFVLVQAAGLFLIWLAGTSLIATSEPRWPVLATRWFIRASVLKAINGSTPQNRGMVMGIYTAFLDVAMAIGSPALGWVGGHLGLNAIFSGRPLAVLSTAVVAFLLLKHAGQSKTKSGLNRSCSPEVYCSPIVHSVCLNTVI
ncbi:major facilitator superfamily protein [Klebsiella variicola]|nr:major facilitator superfamily protein [Klebsiella variicola]